MLVREKPPLYGQLLKRGRLPERQRYNMPMNALIDFLPAVAFFVAWKLYGVYAATAVLIAAMFALVAWYGVRERRLHKVHFFTALVAAVLGGITLYVHDARFIKFKPTVIYAVFALVLLGSQVIGGTVLLQRLGRKTLELPDAVWRRVNLAWAIFFAFSALLNWYIAFHLPEAVWVNFKVYGFSVLMLVFLLAHLPFLKRYLPQS